MTDTIQEVAVTSPKTTIEIKGLAAWALGVGFNDNTDPVIWFKVIPFLDDINRVVRYEVLGVKNGAEWPANMEYAGTASRAAPMGVRTIHLFYRRLA